MKKGLLILVAILYAVGLVSCGVKLYHGYVDYINDPTQFYWPGRDTYEWWAGGACQIVGRTKDLNTLLFHGEDIAVMRRVYAYREVDHLLFFIMSEGKIVIDLNEMTYTIYDEAEILPEDYRIVFEKTDSFKWMPQKKNERVVFSISAWHESGNGSLIRPWTIFV